MGWWKDLNFLRRDAEARARAAAAADKPGAKVAPRSSESAEAARKAILAELAAIPAEDAAAIRAAALKAAAARTGVPVPAPATSGRALPLTPKRQALIVDAMKHWAHGHA